MSAEVLNKKIEDEKYNEIVEITAQWGLRNPHELVNKHAEYVLMLKNRPLVEIAIKTGAISKEFADKKNHDFNTIHKESPEFRENYDFLRAVRSGVLYFPVRESLSNLHVNDSFKKEGELAREMSARKAAIMAVNGRNFIIFSGYDEYQSFRAMGTKDKLNSLLWELINESPESWTFSITTLSIYNRLLSTDDFVQGGMSLEADSENILTDIKATKSKGHKNLVDLIESANSLGATDISIYPENNDIKIAFRIHKGLVYQPSLAMSFSDYEDLTRLAAQMSGANPSGSKLRRPCGGQFTYVTLTKEIFLRCSFIPLDNRGSSKEYVSIDMRLLPKKQSVINFELLNIPDHVANPLRNASSAKQGMVLVSGPTNSGKSTTLAAMIEANREVYGDSLKRMSIEDPVERQLPGVLHIKVPRHLEKEGENAWKLVLEEVVRHDPDVINIAEIRDEDSASLSVDASSSGHLTFSTTHANDALATYRRVREKLKESQWPMLLESLLCLVSQRLIPTVCPHCSSKVKASDLHKNRFDFYKKSRGLEESDLSVPNEVLEVNHEGCDNCQGGYVGMVAVNEVLTVTPEVRRILEDDKSSMKDLYGFCDVVKEEEANRHLHDMKISFDDSLI